MVKRRMADLVRVEANKPQFPENHATQVYLLLANHGLPWLIECSGRYCAAQLGGWARSLQDSELKGRRYLMEKVRTQARSRRDRAESLKELEQIREEGATHKSTAR